MPRFTEAIPEILASLAGRTGQGRSSTVRDAEPGSFVAVAGAYIAQSCDERTTRVAIDDLRESGCSDPHTLAGADPVEIAEAFRAGGSKSLVKLAGPLVKLARWFAATFDGDSDDGSTPTESIRDGLRAVKGIGPATADAILLGGFGRAAYPVDRATYRILVRHGWIDQGAEYDEVRSLVEGALPDDPANLARLSEDFEALGRLTCRATVAKCDRCPLQGLLPEGGPLGDS